MSASANPQLYVQQISDLYTRQNFTNLQAYFATQNQMVGFQFFEINETNAVTSKNLAHTLGIIPKDIVHTLITGAGKLTWNYSLFSTTAVNYTTTGAIRVRFFVGTYFNDTSTVQYQKTDSWTVGNVP